MLDFLAQVIKTPEIIAVLLTALIAAIARLFQPAARVIWGTSHGFTFLVPGQGNPPGPSFPVHTGTVFVQNVGRKTAEGIEIHLNYRPLHFQIWPTLNYETIENPEHHFTIKIKNLGPREYTTVELLSANLQLPATLRVRTPSGDARLVNFAPMRVFPNWLIRFIQLLTILGTFTSVYLLVRLISFIAES